MIFLEILNLIRLEENYQIINIISQKRKIGDDYYYLGMLALKNDNSDDYVGDIGVAISKNVLL